MFGFGIAFIILGTGLLVIGLTGVTPTNRSSSDAFTGLGCVAWLLGCAIMVGAAANRWFYGCM